MEDSVNAVIEPFPTLVEIEDIQVTGFSNPHSLFERLVLESRNPQQSVVHYLNIHVANTAYTDARLKAILKQSDLVYCDGAGIVLGSKLLGSPLPTRLTAADWFVDMLAYFSEKKCRVYLLGGDPGVPETGARAYRGGGASWLYSQLFCSAIPGD
jgi:UDP-N-acetyl-D-mannosaminuronic acid transferase (WecB/TagA/CpsF family)